MSDLDDRIRSSLDADDRQFLARLDADDSLHREVMAAFRGRRRWISVVGSIAGFLLFVIAVYCGWQVSVQTELRAMFLWSAGGALCAAGLALVKIWFWLELKTHAIVREIKRVELQVASLAAARRDG